MMSTLGRLLAEPAPLACFQGRPSTPWLIVGLVSVGAFVGQLDATIVQLALPTLGRDFGASLPAVSWVALSYLLAFAACLPIFGRLCEIVGRKALYILGYALFVLASALCALAASLEQLVAFRCLQGVGGALLGANSIVILVKSVPAESRGRALGYFAAAQAIGMSAGPALGGLILASLGWRWIFWVTVPFGAVAIALGWLVLPRSAAKGPLPSFDWGGALLVGPAIILFVSALNHAAGWGLASPRFLGCLALAGLLGWLLMRREAASDSPLIDPRLFRGVGFRAGAVAVSLAYALLYGIFFLMSFAQEHGYGETPAQAGLRLAILPIALGLTAPFSHAVRDRLGARRIGLAGMACCLCGILLLGVAASDPARHHLIDPLAYILMGAGLGVFIAPNNDATIGAAPPDLSSAAGAQLNLMRVLGTSLGVAAAATTLAWRLHVETGSSRDWLSAGSDALLAAFRDSLPVLACLAIGAAVAARIAVTSARHRARPD